MSPPYKKLQPLISAFIKNSIFANNRDPWITLYMTKIKKRQANIFCAVHPQVMDIEERTVLLIYACITGDTTPTTMLSGTRSFPLLMLFSPCLRAFIGHDGRGFKSSEGHCQIVPATLRNQRCGECTEEQPRINLQLGGNTQEVAGESMRDWRHGRYLLVWNQSKVFHYQLLPK